MSNRRPHLILIGLILVALAGVALLGAPGSPVQKKTTLGLDLQGGLEVVLKAVPPKGHKLTSQDVDRSVSIMRNRIDKLGVSEPEIRKQGPNQIVIQLAGVHDPASAARLIGKTASLELYDLEADLTGPSIDAQGLPRAQTSIFGLLVSQQSLAKRGAPESYYLIDKQKRVIAGPADSRQALLERRKGKAPAGAKIFAVPQSTVVVSCGTTAVVCPGANESPPTRTYHYLFKNDPAKGIPEMTGRDLKLSGTRLLWSGFVGSCLKR